MFIKVLLTIIFFVVVKAVGVYSRQQAKSVDGFVLGGRSVGPWLTAFAYGTSYFSAVVFLVSLVTPKLPSASVNTIFSCYSRQ